MSWQSILLVLAGTFATFGAATLPFRRASTGAIRSLVATATVVTLVVGIALGWFVREGSLGVIGRWWGGQFEAALDAVLQPGGPSTAPGATLLIAGIAGAGVALLAARLPEHALEPEGREAERRLLEGSKQWGGRVGLVAGTLGVTLLVVPHSLWSTVIVSDAVYDLLVGVTGSAEVRFLCLLVAVLALLGTVLLAVLEYVRATYLPEPSRLLAQCLGGVVIVVGLQVVGPGSIVSWLTDTIPRDGAHIVERVVAETSATIFVVGATFAASALLTLLLAGVAGLGRTGALPARSASAVIAGCGMAIAALAAGMIGGPSVLLVGAVVAAVLVWELAAYELALVAEVGVDAPTRRAELVHVGSLVPVAALVGAGVVAASALLRGANPSSSGALAALVAALLLGTILRK